MLINRKKDQTLNQSVDLIRLRIRYFYDKLPKKYGTYHPVNTHIHIFIESERKRQID